MLHMRFNWERQIPNMPFSAGWKDYIPIAHERIRVPATISNKCLYISFTLIVAVRVGRTGLIFLDFR